METDYYNIARLKVGFRKVVALGDGSSVNLDNVTNSLHVAFPLVFRTLLYAYYGHEKVPVDRHGHHQSRYKTAKRIVLSKAR